MMMSDSPTVSGLPSAHELLARELARALVRESALVWEPVSEQVLARACRLRTTQECHPCT